MPLRRSCKRSLWRAPKPPARASSTYVVLTPILTAVLLRERILRSTWVAVFMATAGLATLSRERFRVWFR